DKTAKLTTLTEELSGIRRTLGLKMITIIVLKHLLSAKCQILQHKEVILKQTRHELSIIERKLEVRQLELAAARRGMLELSNQKSELQASIQILTDVNIRKDSQLILLRDEKAVAYHKLYLRTCIVKILRAVYRAKCRECGIVRQETVRLKTTLQVNEEKYGTLQAKLEADLKVAQNQNSELQLVLDDSKQAHQVCRTLNEAARKTLENESVSQRVQIQNLESSILAKAESYIQMQSKLENQIETLKTNLDDLRNDRQERVSRKSHELQTVALKEAQMKISKEVEDSLDALGQATVVDSSTARKHNRRSKGHNSLSSATAVFSQTIHADEVPSRGSDKDPRQTNVNMRQPLIKRRSSKNEQLLNQKLDPVPRSQMTVSDVCMYFFLPAEIDARQFRGEEFT
ncbi:hypothetical protein EV360DRAFT_73776, partial [Lentinula raphanica]